MQIKTNSLIVLLLVFVINASANQPDQRKEKCGTTSHMNQLRDINRSLNRNESTADYINQIEINKILSNRNSNTIYTIPVVVHVLWNTSAENISDAQIMSQIDVLNEDFGRRNADTTSTPTAFAGVAAVTSFQFCLAQVDPNGNFTNGIERRQTTISEFGTDDDMKFFNRGGLNAWNTDNYLNIWVCNLADDVLGYAELPDILPKTNTFGVVVEFDAFGRVGMVTPPYHRGRTCTHEISHCFDLRHIWGDDGGSCGGPGDYVNDTPDQADATYDCHPFPLLDACSNTSPGIMYMNYMDYSDDNCMNMFSQGQATRMLDSITHYYPTLLSSQRCIYVGVDEVLDNFRFSIYPNPANGTFVIDLFNSKISGTEVKLLITDALGKTVYDKNLDLSVGYVHLVDLSNNANGIYFVTIKNDVFSKSNRLILYNQP